MATQAVLGTFDDRDITATTIAILGAGDGLSKALKVDPAMYHSGDRITVVLDCVVGAITHRPIDDSNDCVREHRARAVLATVVNRKLVQDALEAQADRIEQAEQVTGQMKLSAEAKQEADHASGQHVRFRKACPMCVAEKAARDAADPLGVHGDEAVAKRDELAAKRAEHGDGEGDADNPTPPARKRRSRAKPKH